MRRPFKLPRLNVRLVFIALTATGILHIVSTFIAPEIATAPAFARLRPLLPLNTMVVLPPVVPGAQPLPFLSPNVRYAMCRFTTESGPLEVSARLPSAGWTLSVHLDSGENVYTAAAESGRAPDVRILLMPADDRFLGLTPEARGIAREGPGALEVRANAGIAVVRGPELGIAFAREVEAELAQSRCRPAEL